MSKQYNVVDQITGRLFGMEMAKNGSAMSDKVLPSMSRSELLADRNAVRRTIDNLSARCEKEMKQGDQAAFDKTMALIGAGRDIIHNLQIALDQLDLDDDLIRNNRTPNTVSGVNGSRIHLLNATDRFADLTRGAQQVDYGIGELLANMVGRGNNAAIRNDLAEGSDATGGATVPTHLVGQVIDKMRAQMVTIKAGAKTLALDTNVTKVARLTTDPTASWRLEAGALATSDPAFDVVTFTARSLAVKFDVSIELMEDSANFNDVVQNALARSLALELDRVALFGTGTPPEPKGIFADSNINTVSMGAAGALPTDYSQVLDALYQLQLSNADAPTALIAHPRTFKTFNLFKDTTNQPLRVPSALEGIPRLSTTTIPITQTVGASGAVCSSLFLGDFSQLWVGVRQGLRIEVLRATKYASNLQYTFIAHLRADVGIAQPKAFCTLTGIKAS